MDTELLKYPTGKFEFPETVSKTMLNDSMDEIERFPAELSARTSGLSTEQLERTYRDGGWTIRQIIHHLADSHLNSYIRFKWALTEENPLIKAYNQSLWALTPEVGNTDISDSLLLLISLHNKWVHMMRSFDDTHWSKTFIHPEKKRTVRLDQNVCLYAWHGKHHLAHIDLCLRNGE